MRFDFQHGLTAKRTRKVAMYLLVIFVTWVALVLFVQRRMLYPRYLVSSTHHQPLVESTPGVQSIWIETPQGSVEGWLILGRGVSPTQPGPAVIVAHGNAELIDDVQPLIDTYHQAGVTVLLPEYRGYGRSAGRPSQHAIGQDFVRFYDRLASRTEVDSDRIFFYGRSLGGGVLCDLALKRTPAAIVLQSPFTSVAAVAGRFLVPRWLVLDPYNNLEALKQVRCPLLIIHGRHDTVIPYRHSQALHTAAPHSRMITYDCGHNDFPPDWGVFWRDVFRFLHDHHIVAGD